MNVALMYSSTFGTFLPPMAGDEIGFRNPFEARQD